MQFPRRSAHHTDLSFRRSVHSGQRCRAKTVGSVESQEVALALAAADQVADRHQRISRAAELAVERARYDAGRAERAFHAVEPDNRLVARNLESRWEATLAALAEAEQSLQAAHDTLLPLPGRAELELLAADLAGLWHAPTTRDKDRKRLLRTLISDTTLRPELDHSKVRIGIRWHTGACDELTVDCAARTVLASSQYPMTREMQ